MLQLLTIETFLPLVGDDFIIRGPNDQVLTLALLRADPLKNANMAGTPLGTRAPFALLFRGPHRPQLLQGTFKLEHPGLDEDGIFLVPVKSESDGMYYEAVFA